MKKRKYLYLKMKFSDPYLKKRMLLITFLKKLDWTTSPNDYRVYIKYM